MKVLFVVGAGRSGTNILAKILSADPRIQNAFESRYIWNFGQKDISIDCRQPVETNGKIAKYIRKKLFKIAGPSTQVLIDKTPGNALRIPFVLSVFPNAKVVNIIRDGRASVLSRVELWDQPSGVRPSRILQRIVARSGHLVRLVLRGNIPLDRLPTALWDQFSRLSGEHSKRSLRLGERIGVHDFPAGVDDPLVYRALQWQEVVSTSLRDGRILGDDSYLEIRYEDFVFETDRCIKSIFDFLSLDDPECCIRFADSEVVAKKDQNRLGSLDKNDEDVIEDIVGTTLKELGYINGL
ncbi:MAG: sulfotransferase [Pseudomonadota bacterium]